MRTDDTEGMGVLTRYFVVDFFLMILAIRETFLKSFWCQQGNIRACKLKTELKIDVDPCLDGLVVKKVVFFTFSKLFWFCLKSL